jgi:hypothetical protein
MCHIDNTKYNNQRCYNTAIAGKKRTIHNFTNPYPLCNATHGLLDFLVVRVNTDPKVIQRSTCCAIWYCAVEDQDSNFTTTPPPLISNKLDRLRPTIFYKLIKVKECFMQVNIVYNWWQLKILCVALWQHIVIRNVEYTLVDIVQLYIWRIIN